MKRLEVNVETGEVIEHDLSAEEVAEREAYTPDRVAEIDAALVEIDRKTIRPLRDGESERVEQLRLEALELRAERALVLAGAHG